MTDDTNSPDPSGASAAVLVDETHVHTLEELQAEVAKWKALSRKNETAFKAASTELDGIRQSAMSDQERAIEAARTEARTAALSEVGNRLVEAELRASAAAVGATLPAAEFLNTAAFLGADGSPDTERISAFVSTLPKSPVEPVYDQSLGLGRQGAVSGQYTRDDLSRMTRAERIEARKAGKLDALMRGDI
ncbi:hypothetical protein [Embleya hyalina]|nr:hypothetical protein [Embleya hyalina]